MHENVAAEMEDEDDDNGRGGGKEKEAEGENLLVDSLIYRKRRITRCGAPET